MPPISAVEEDRPLPTATLPWSASKARPKEGEADAKPVEVDEIMVEIGGENTIPEFTENLRGAKAGEQRTFDVKYADDFTDKRLAGKSMTYEVNVKGIKTRSVPELNDDFAKELSADLNTVDDLRNRLRENMKAEKEHEAQHQGKDKLVEELVKRNDFPVPEAMLNEQIDIRLERGLRALAAQGMRTEDMKRMDFARLRAGQREAALREVKASLILEQIADEEKIEVSDEEFEREIEALAKQSKQTVEQVRARLTRMAGWIEFGIASATKRRLILFTGGPHRRDCFQHVPSTMRAFQGFHPRAEPRICGLPRSDSFLGERQVLRLRRAKRERPLSEGTVRKRTCVRHG